MTTRTGVGVLVVALVAAGGLAWRSCGDADARRARTSSQVTLTGDGPVLDLGDVELP